MWIALLSLCALAGTHRFVVEVDGPAPGPIEVVARDGTVLERIPLKDPRLRSIALPEGGGQAAVLDRAFTSVQIPWPDDADHARVGQRILTAKPPPTTSAPVTAVQSSGPSDARLDLVFMGDGYTADQQTDFADDVDWIVAYLLSIEPYGDYTGLYNIWRIDLVSNETGVSHLEEDPDLIRDTALDCFYGCADIDRLVCCDDEAVMGLVDALVPGAEGVMVLVNDPEYGGSGGFDYATAYVGEADGRQVAAHELGHSLVGLWDEYGYGFDGGPEQGPNCAADEDVHWTEWLGTDGVDAFQECSYTGHYRPTQNQCMMRSLNDDYCPVCRQEAVLAIYEAVPQLIVSAQPPPAATLNARQGSAPVTLEVLGPDAGLSVEWTVNEVVVATDTLSFDPRCTGLNGELWVTVRDPTHFVRSDPAGALEDRMGPWPVLSAPCSPPGPRGCGCTTSGQGAAGWTALLLLLALRRRR